MESLFCVPFPIQVLLLIQDVRQAAVRPSLGRLLLNELLLFLYCDAFLSLGCEFFRVLKTKDYISKRVYFDWDQVRIILNCLMSKIYCSLVHCCNFCVTWVLFVFA